MSFVGSWKRKFSIHSQGAQPLNAPMPQVSKTAFPFGLIPRNEKYSKRLEFLKEAARYDVLPWQFTTRARMSYYGAVLAVTAAALISLHELYAFGFEADELKKEFEERKAASRIE